MDRGTLILSASDVRALLPLETCIDAVQDILARHARGEAGPPAALGVPSEGGGFHVKAAAARLARPYFVAKTNGNFPGNPSANGRPTIQGVLVLCDAGNGAPLAVMDSMEVTTLRTGAATGVAARFLAREGSSAVTVVGCGVQGRVQLHALAAVLELDRVYAVDARADVAAAFADEMTDRCGLPVTVATDLAEATRRSDVVVTCTPSRRPLLHAGDVRPGAFVAAVGADHPYKHEIAPDLFAGAAVIVDSLDQAAELGDLHHAIEAAVVDRSDVRAELGQVVVGSSPGRLTSEEVVLFDSTGIALQDVAAAALVYERAVASGRGLVVSLAD